MARDKSSLVWNLHSIYVYLILKSEGNGAELFK